MSKSNYIKIFIDVLVWIFLSIFPICIVLLPFERDVFAHNQRHPISLNIMLIDLIPFCFGMFWLAFRYPKVAKFGDWVGKQKRKNPFLYLVSVMVSALAMALFVGIYFHTVTYFMNYAGTLSRYFYQTLFENV